MKKIIFWTTAFALLVSATIYGFAPSKVEVDNKAIKWYTLEEAIAANEKNQKKLFIDIYTEWCGWCKVMDKKTFTDPDVIRYINENFYAVKFDAEQKEDLRFKGKDYKFVQGGRRGIHEFAYTLLDRQASYPSFVLLDEELNRLGIIKGFKKSEPLLATLKEHLVQ